MTQELVNLAKATEGASKVAPLLTMPAAFCEAADFSAFLVLLGAFDFEVGFDLGFGPPVFAFGVAFSFCAASVFGSTLPFGAVFAFGLTFAFG
ncbi:MAG: hypothetical protein NWQ24_06635, partial [Haliea sp.]|nr:hypothetical protein [Haliea sp.]